MPEAAYARRCEAEAVLFRLATARKMYLDRINTEPKP
jgi:hypothetical protein